MHRKYVLTLAVILSVLIAAAAALTAQGTQATAAKKGRTIEVLFLGHNSKHHDSARFEPMLASAIEAEGFQFTYTADPNELNAANLARYDALMIYANHTTIAPDQEKGLRDCGNSDKGSLPIHCASFCFQNSPAYIALV